MEFTVLDSFRASTIHDARLKPAIQPAHDAPGHLLEINLQIELR